MKNIGFLSYTAAKMSPSHKSAQSSWPVAGKIHSVLSLPPHSDKAANGEKGDGKWKRGKSGEKREGGRKGKMNRRIYSKNKKRQHT